MTSNIRTYVFSIFPPFTNVTEYWASKLTNRQAPFTMAIISSMSLRMTSPPSYCITKMHEEQTLAAVTIMFVSLFIELQCSHMMRLMFECRSASIVRTQSGNTVPDDRKCFGIFRSQRPTVIWHCSTRSTRFLFTNNKRLNKTLRWRWKNSTKCKTACSWT